MKGIPEPPTPPNNPPIKDPMINSSCPSLVENWSLNAFEKAEV